MNFLALAVVAVPTVVVLASSSTATTASISAKNPTEILDDPVQEARFLYQEIRSKLLASLPTKDNLDEYMPENARQILPAMELMARIRPTVVDFFTVKMVEDAHAKVQNNISTYAALADIGSDIYFNTKDFDVEEEECPINAVAPFLNLASPLCSVLEQMGKLMRPEAATDVKAFVVKTRGDMEDVRKRLFALAVHDARCVQEHREKQRELVEKMAIALATSNSHSRLSAIIAKLTSLFNDRNIALPKVTSPIVFQGMQAALDRRASPSTYTTLSSSSASSSALVDPVVMAKKLHAELLTMLSDNLPSLHNKVDFKMSQDSSTLGPLLHRIATVNEVFKLPKSVAKKLTECALHGPFSHATVSKCAYMVIDQLAWPSADPDQCILAAVEPFVLASEALVVIIVELARCMHDGRELETAASNMLPHIQECKRKLFDLAAQDDVCVEGHLQTQQMFIPFAASKLVGAVSMRKAPKAHFDLTNIVEELERLGELTIEVDAVYLGVQDALTAKFSRPKPKSRLPKRPTDRTRPAVRPRKGLLRCLSTKPSPQAPKALRLPKRAHSLAMSPIKRVPLTPTSTSSVVSKLSVTTIRDNVEVEQEKEEESTTDDPVIESSTEEEETESESEFECKTSLTPNHIISVDGSSASPMAKINNPEKFEKAPRKHPRSKDE